MPTTVTHKVTIIKIINTNRKAVDVVDFIVPDARENKVGLDEDGTEWNKPPTTPMTPGSSTTLFRNRTRDGFHATRVVRNARSSFDQ